MAAPELVFVGQIAPDGDTYGEDVAAQSRSVLARLEATLTERELRLDDLLRLRLFVRDLDDLSTIEHMLDSSGPAEWPAMSVVELPAGSTPGVAVTLDAVAASGARERRRVVRLSAAGDHNADAGPGSPPCSVRLGPWVFVGATAASRRSPSSSPPYDPDADSVTRRIGDESLAVFARIEQLLRAQDAELRDVVSVGGWLTFPVRRSDYRPLGDVRKALLAREGLFPASAAARVVRVAPAGALLAFEAIAFAPEDPVERGQWRAASLPPPSPLAPYYASARRAGGYVFTCGEVPTGTAEPGSPAAVGAQAGEVYERLRADLTAHGTSPGAVVHQTVFVRRVGEGTAIAEAARAFYGTGASAPPTTLLGIADIGFDPGCDVEIELVAAADGRAADGR